VVGLGLPAPGFFESHPLPPLLGTTCRSFFAMFSSSVIDMATLSTRV
jgi:hypothetical protein